MAWLFLFVPLIQLAVYASCNITYRQVYSVNTPRTRMPRQTRNKSPSKDDVQKLLNDSRHLLEKKAGNESPSEQEIKYLLDDSLVELEGRVDGSGTKAANTGPVNANELQTRLGRLKKRDATAAKSFAESKR